MMNNESNYGVEISKVIFSVHRDLIDCSMDGLGWV